MGTRTVRAWVEGGSGNDEDSYSHDPIWHPARDVDDQLLCIEAPAGHQAERGFSDHLDPEEARDGIKIPLADAPIGALVFVRDVDVDGKVLYMLHEVLE
jgi:hypothetical protein